MTIQEIFGGIISMADEIYADKSKKTAKLMDRTLIPPCQAACPLHMDIREYVDLVSQGRIMEALQVIRDGNPFPSICAYVCTHPCEEECRRNQVDKPVSIRSLKRFAVEFGGDRMIQVDTDNTYNEKVAIVGSGPAGMACANYLRKLGYPVTIFEAHSDIGGMLRVGIPKYRLPQEVLDVEVQRLIQMGVEIMTNTRVVSLDLLFDMGYKAIFVTIGAHQSLKIGIEGEDNPGVLDGAVFLREVNLGLKPNPGKRVAIVGGGNVAIDAARTAVRLGAVKVNILYRRSLAEMPADPGEIKQAQEEGVEILFLATPVRITRKDEHLVVTCNRMELGEPDASGRRKPVPVKGKNRKFTRVFDTLISAIGQAPQLPGDFKLRMSKGSTIQIDPVTLTTNRMGVFAGGDAVTGPATVTEALAAGRAAAYRIHDFLQHKYPLPVKEKREMLTGKLTGETIKMIKKIGRKEPHTLSPEKRAADFQPVELVFSWKEAINEARRCLRCGMGAEIMFQDRCATCLTCLRVCPYHVPFVDSSGSIQIPVSQCQACGICVGECPARAIVMRKPNEQRYIAEELEHTLKSALESKLKPMIIGFCCQYGLFGTGALAGLWREASAGVWIIPVLCIAKVETEHLLYSLEKGADGVFVAGCGEQCARENTAAWVHKRIDRVREVLTQIGQEPERVQAFTMENGSSNPGKDIDMFIERIGKLYLADAIREEVKK
jgi:NADPH-dependent glutamate synthase beta subunit-like oxidoreductase/coenzyme F420-reducing hydrogenase delta subunit